MNPWCQAIGEKVSVNVVQSLLTDRVNKKKHSAADWKALVVKISVALLSLLWYMSGECGH